MPKQSTVRIAMWSGPRNLSTALMRAWENRGDTAVCDEPFYACFLAATGAKHPGAKEVVAHGESNWERVAERMIGPIPDDRPVFFQKHMAHHLLPEIGRGWMDRVINCFLIRDPREVIASYARVRGEVSAEDIGIARQAAIFGYVQQRQAQTPLVLDARDLLENPRGLLSALCDRLGIEFTDRMLTWSPGPRDSDGIWARHWYGSVYKSTGFHPHVSKADRLPPRLEPLARECESHYRRLWRHRLLPP